HRLYLKNIGIGTAINIEIARIDFAFPTDEDRSTTTEPLATNHARAPEGKNGYTVFQPIQSLSPDSEQVVKSFNHPADPDRVGEVIRKYGYTGFYFLSFIDEKPPFCVIFQDIVGNKYHQFIRREGVFFVPSQVKFVGGAGN